MQLKNMKGSQIKQSFTFLAFDKCVTGKFTDFRVVVQSTFIRKLSHLTISNLFEFIQVLSFKKKKYIYIYIKKKTTVAFGIDFFVTRFHYAPARRHFCYLLLVSFR